MKIELPLQSLNDIPLAYKQAIDKYKEHTDRDWGSVELLKIEFQNCNLRQEHIAIFEVI